jgi:hypothetical protein
LPDQPQWIEIDLGQPRAVDSGRIVWYDTAHFGVEFVVEARLFPEQDWLPLFTDSEGRPSAVDFEFQPQWIRYVRLSGTHFAGQDRMLIRRFHLFACLEAAAGELPTYTPPGEANPQVKDDGQLWATTAEAQGVEDGS